MANKSETKTINSITKRNVMKIQYAAVVLISTMIGVNASKTSPVFAAAKKNPASTAAKVPTKVDAMAILEKAEKIRNPVEDYSVKVDLVDSKGGKIDNRSYETFIKGRDKALVKFVKPVSESGTRVLMTGPDMYVYIPTSAKPVRVSANQKLTGNAAYGDVTRLSFVGNYTPTYRTTEKSGGREVIILDLESIAGQPVTYDKVEYHVDAKTMYPVKAIYKTRSGKPIREGTFEDYGDIFGVNRPTTFVLKNLLKKDHVTRLKFSDAKSKKLPALMFEKQNLGRQ